MKGISELHQLLLIVDELKEKLDSENIDECSWLYNRLSSKSDYSHNEFEEELFQKLNSTGGGCDIDWINY